MVASQFEALDEPADALVVDVSPPPKAIVEHSVAGARAMSCLCRRKPE
jgi:gluconate kinase